MIKQIPSYLKLVTDTSSETQAACEDTACMVEVCRAFGAALGWPLEIVPGPKPAENTGLMWSAPVNPGVGNSPGHIRLLSSEAAAGQAAAPFESAVALAAALAKLWNELMATRHALAQREAELASGIPLIVRHGDEPGPPLGERLEAVLRAGAEAIGCDAAALYLLDAATTELKLRSSWGLPRKRMTEPARPLRGALADLEALLGHAVVTNDERLQDYWKVPEQGFAACLCVPVLSQSMPLGTLWVFSRAMREFSDVQTNVVEVVAGRMAADLEREALVGEAVAARQQARQLAAAHGSRHCDLPTVAPHVDGWEVAAHVFHAGPLGGTFYDWLTADRAGRLAVLAGDTMEQGLAGALTAAAVRAASRASDRDLLRPGQLLKKINAVLWSTSSGRQAAGLFQAILEPGNASCSFAASGPMRTLAVGPCGHVALHTPATALGQDEELSVSMVRHPMAEGELLVVYGTSFLSDPTEQSLATLDIQLAAAIASHPHLPAQGLIDIAAEVLANHQSPTAPADRVLLIIKRCGV